MERILHCGQNCPENISEKGGRLAYMHISMLPLKKLTGGRREIAVITRCLREKENKVP
jgi:hypothetical protein